MRSPNAVVIALLLMCFSCGVKAPLPKVVDNITDSGQGTLIEATLTAIVEHPKSEAVPKQCEGRPCFGKARVDRILRAGMDGTILSDHEIDVFFVYSLNETDSSVFPELLQHYPGLKLRNRFKAEVLEPFDLDGKKVYSVYAYVQID